MALNDRAKELQNEDVAYNKYLNICADKINAFLKEQGSSIHYDPSKDSGYVEFITNNFEPCTKEQKAIIDFVETLPPYESSLKITPFKMDSYNLFFELEIPYDLTKKEFSTEENYRVYKQHVFSATHDFD